MRFLADESCDAALVRALRAAGHDVISIAETSFARSTLPQLVIELAATRETELLAAKAGGNRLDGREWQPNRATA